MVAGHVILRQILQNARPMAKPDLRAVGQQTAMAQQAAATPVAAISATYSFHVSSNSMAAAITDVHAIASWRTADSFAQTAGPHASRRRLELHWTDGPVYGADVRPAAPAGPSRWLGHPGSSHHGRDRWAWSQHPISWQVPAALLATLIDPSHLFWFIQRRQI